MKHQPLPTLDLALQYNERLPARIRRYLEARGIAAWVQDRFLLGWNGHRITIPVYDEDGRLFSFRLARDPEAPDSGPKMLSTPGARAELYGWEHLRKPTPRLVIAEGEFDRLVLEARGFSAVTSTGGAGVFREEWAEKLARVPQVYIAFDRDAAGRRGANKVARLLPDARIVRLPEEVGKGGDVTDFFVRLGKTKRDFWELLQAARPASEPKEPPRRGPRSAPRTPSAVRHQSDIAALKALVPIERVVGRYLTLERRGGYFMARCPFHDDKTPSFVVYPGTQTFHCFGCGAHGDVLDFLEKHHGVGFREALDRLRRLAA